MGPRSRHTAQEGDFGAKSANQSQNNSKGPCEDAGGNRYKVSMSTVKQVLYQHHQKGRSARKKPLLQNGHKKPENCFQLHMGTKIVLFGEMSSGLMKQK